MPEVILRVAGLSLKIEEQGKFFLSGNFSDFIYPSRKPPQNYWSLEYPLNGFASPLINFIYSQILALNQGLFLHAACVIKNKQAYLFLAASGGGKSTLAKLSARYRVIGDDVIALRKNRYHYLAFSTPWNQNCFFAAAAMNAPVRAVFFLKKSRKISFQPIPPEEALVRILSRHTHFFFSTGKPLAEKMFFTCAEFVKQVPAYLMEFRKNKDFWPDLQTFLRQQRCLK